MLDEDRFWQLLEAAPDALVIVDRDGTITVVNSQAEQLFGYTRAELLGQPVELLVPGRFRKQHPAYRMSYFREPHVRPMGSGTDLYGLRKDGSEFPVEISLSPIQTPAGMWAISSIRDITPRKRAEEAIRKQAQMLDLANDTIMIRDLNDTITYWNKGAARLYGWSPEEAIGQHVHTLLQTIFPLPLEEIKTTCLRDHHWQGELIHNRRNGPPMTVDSRWTLQYDANGKAAAFLEINNDVTERRRVERALQEKNVELEQASLVKDRFLATMSHELRTPLNAIIGFTGTLLMELPGAINDDQKEQLQTIENSAMHLLSLINDLLDLAKIESGKVELRREPIVCQVVIQEVMTTLRAMAEGKGLRLEAAYPTKELVVQTDRRALTQILLNLTNNGIKFTVQGEVRIELGQRNQDGRLDTIISVTDTGSGIRPEDQAKLFQAFEQVGGTGKGRQLGTGLGLYLSQKLAELLGGRIDLQSQHGQGSTFHLVLPGGEP